MKSMRKCAVLFAAVLLAAASVRAQTVDTVEVYSPSMDKKIKNVVILPAGYGRNAVGRYPVVYLLHGYNNRYDSWLRKTKPELPQTASAFGVIVVCPDGELVLGQSGQSPQPLRDLCRDGTGGLCGCALPDVARPPRAGDYGVQYGRAWRSMARFPASGRFRRVRVDERWSRYPAFPEQLENQRATRSVCRKPGGVGRTYRTQSTVPRGAVYRCEPGGGLDESPAGRLRLAAGTIGYRDRLRDGRLFFRGQPAAPRADAVLSYFPRLHRAARTTYARLLAQRGRVPSVFFSAFFRYATEPVGRAYLNSSALYSGCLSR